ncbi:MAG: helix-turn-helix transcriptional regulator [Myxococcales bacterium]|nr:helix-turn-helix transcriptional regulator [Myxococcales bacterium]
MSGRIQGLNAGIVLNGVRAAAPDAIRDRALADRLLADAEDGVPLRPYRRLLAEALEHDGGVALLRCGELIPSLPHPLVFVLLNSDSPRLLIEKEARLAAFFHSRHRVRIEAEDARSITLRHTGPESEPPEDAEDLAALGQHFPLFAEIGCQDLRCRLPESAAPDRWVYDRGVVAAPEAGGGYALWRLEWTSFTPTRRPMPGLDETLLAAVGESALDEASGAAARVEQVVRRDLGRTWRVAEVAEVLGFSARALQRALAAEGERYSNLLDQLRNREAARLLRETSFSITEIGYVCGFADGAHFSRSFKKRHGASPSAYRAALA